MNIDRLRVDQHSSTWLHLSAYIDGRIDELIQRLQTDIAQDETGQIRARLKELRLIKSRVSVDETLIDEDFDLPN